MAVDWSAAARPVTGRDSVWVAWAGVGGRVRTANPPTRGGAESLLVGLLDRSLGAGERVLVGYDFSFGYPAGAAALFPGGGPVWDRPWRWLERHLADTPVTNANDRFAAAATLNGATGLALFFGRPPAAAHPHLAATRREVPAGLAPNPFPPYRVTERLARRQAGAAVCSGWHLYGGVSVGSQVLTGLPHLQRLRRRYGRELCVWPQETGFVADPLGARPGARVLVAELWPTALAPSPGRGASDVRDRAQVRSAAAACRSRQMRPGGLAGWFSPPAVGSMGRTARRDAREEGWILGIR